MKIKYVWDEMTMIKDLNDEVADDSTIIGVHTRAECVENACHPDLDLGLTFISIPDTTYWEGERISETKRKKEGERKTEEKKKTEGRKVKRKKRWES